MELHSSCPAVVGMKSFPRSVGIVMGKGRVVSIPGLLSGYFPISGGGLWPGRAVGV